MTAFVGAGVLMLVAGLVIDLTFTRPRMEQIGRLEAERDTLVRRLAQQAAFDKKGRDLLGFLQTQNLADGLFSPLPSDPLTYVGGLIEKAGLTRLELTDRGSETMGKTDRARLDLRVEGSFRQTLALVRELEQGARLGVISDFEIQPASDGARLETRLSLFVYDPQQGNER